MNFKIQLNDNTQLRDSGGLTITGAKITLCTAFVELTVGFSGCF